MFDIITEKLLLFNSRDAGRLCCSRNVLIGHFVTYDVFTNAVRNSRNNIVADLYTRVNLCDYNTVWSTAPCWAKQYHSFPKRKYVCVYSFIIRHSLFLFFYLIDNHKICGNNKDVRRPFCLWYYHRKGVYKNIVRLQINWIEF